MSVFATKDELRYGLETHAGMEERRTGDGEVNESIRTYPAPDVGRRSNVKSTRIEPAGHVGTSETGSLRTRLGGRSGGRRGRSHVLVLVKGGVCWIGHKRICLARLDANAL